MKKKPKREIQFAVCVNNKKYEASLELGKLYRIIPDEKGESHGYLRIVEMRVARIMDIRRTAFFVSTYPSHWSAPC